MKYLCLLFFVGTLYIACKHQTSFEQELKFSIEKLSELNKNKVSDTLILRGALDTAYQVAVKTSNLQHDSLFAAVCRSYGNAFYYNEPHKAISIYRKGLSIGLRQLPPTDYAIALLYKTTAQLYFIQDDYKTALIYFDSVKINAQAPKAQNVKLDFMTMIAECYMNLNEQISAVQIMSEVEPIAQKLYAPQQLGLFYTNYARYLRLQKKLSEAIQKVKLGEVVFQKLRKNQALTATDSLAWANNAFGEAHIFHDSKDFHNSEIYYLQALQIYDQIDNHYNYQVALKNLGNMYFLSNQFDKGESMLSKSLKLCNQSDLDDATIRLKVDLFQNRSEIYLKTKQYSKAIADYDSVIYLFNQYREKPSLTPLQSPILIPVLKDKIIAFAALAENGSDTDGYTKTLQLTQQIVELTDDIRADYFSNEAKLTLANDVKPAFEKAISVCQKLYQKTKDKQYLVKAFNFVEYSRSMVLYENARLDNQLPPDLKAENEELKKREAALIAKNNVEDLQNYLRLKRQFREKIKALNRNQLASVATCQTELLKDDQTAFVEYFVGDSTIFAFTLLKNGLNLYEIHKPKDFEQKIETLREGITQKRPVHDATDFAKQSAELYALLGQECIGNLQSSISKLIIAPDGVLAYLPFELLLKSAPSSQNPEKKQGIAPIDFRQIDYLLKHYQISYAYSANLLLAQKQIKKHNTSRLFAGFAPEYQAKDTAVFAMTHDNTRAVLTRKEAYSLGGAKREVQAISELVGGNAFLSESATEGVFKKESNKYRILHFAMHSITDDKDPLLSKLLFTLSSQDTTEDNDLNASEIYTLQLNADLAVLSACNTGYGKLNKGEGVMSLARAFSYAGVPATVTSLWKASDLTTPEIMLDFYKNLKLGMPKDAALHQAKLTYLKDAPESVAANPYFWAAFVPLGNMKPLDLSKNPSFPIFSGQVSIWAIAIGLTALFSVGFWLWKVKFTKLK